MTFGYLVSVAFLSSSALMVGFTLLLGFLNYRDNKEEAAAVAPVAPIPAPAPAA
jgi:hypothetical protein